LDLQTWMNLPKKIVHLVYGKFAYPLHICKSENFSSYCDRKQKRIQNPIEP
jgi:hypothetical protein